MLEAPVWGDAGEPKREHDVRLEAHWGKESRIRPLAVDFDMSTWYRPATPYALSGHDLGPMTRLG